MNEPTRTHSIPPTIAALLAALAALAALLVVTAAPAGAQVGPQALILETTVSGGASSPEATRASALGFGVTLVDEPTWAGMTATDFAAYQLVVVGDPTCRGLPAVVSQNAAALADAVMARAGGNSVVGNRLLIGTDPVFHLGQGGQALVDTGIDFAGVRSGATGLYLDFSCFDTDFDADSSPDGLLLLDLLTLDPGTWTENPAPPCGGSASLISNADQFATLTSADLQGWGCSVHMTFPTFPTDWTALAIATDAPTMPTCGTDVDTGLTACGEAHVLIAGSGIVVVAPDLAVTPGSATNPVGTTHTVTATVTNPDDSPRPGVLVDFVVTGANAGATGVCVPADCVSDANGEVTFTYTGTVEGEDTINAAITVDGSRQTATAAKTWTAATGGELICRDDHGHVLEDGDHVRGHTIVTCTFTGGPVEWHANGMFRMLDPNGTDTMRFLARSRHGIGRIAADLPDGSREMLSFDIRP